MRLILRHRTKYTFPAPAALGAHVVRLRPASHVKAKIETYGLRVSEGGELRWQQDPYGNHVARITFLRGTRLRELELDVELALDVRPVNPFDFMVDDRYENVPFAYAADLEGELHPFLDLATPCLGGGRGERLSAFFAELPTTGRIVPLLADITQRVATRTRYVVREEAGVWTPEQTLAEGRGSCRDSALLLIAALRSRGLAARFVSGYLIQLTDEGMIPGAPRGVGKDVADLHAWAEVYLPGAGWIGLDATSGLFCGEGHIPLACTASPSLAAPIEGTSDLAASAFSFELTIGRLGHEPRPTAPYEEAVWEALLDGGDRADAQLARAKLPLTVGGEPTFNAREDVDAPEWNVAALGASKWTHGEKLASALRTRLAPGSAVLVRQGKHYPGEPLPRWAIDLVARTDGKPVWTRPIASGCGAKKPTLDDARALVGSIARRLDLADFVTPAHEDPWRLVQTEANLPIDIDPLAHDLDAPAERQRLARLLGGGARTEVGYALPLARVAKGAGWRSSTWKFRREHLFLLFGDSPLGLRLPLDSILKGARPPRPGEEAIEPPDPRVEEEDDEDEDDAIVKTALAVEARGDALCVFLPPVAEAEDFFALVAIVEAAAVELELELDVRLEGYPPPASPLVERIAVTPDPGVLEVNLPPTKTTREHAKLLDTVFDAALHAGLHSEKYLMDGRQAGSGGGNHQTLGGPTPLTSPFVTRPDLLASLIVFVQHHPSLSYMFTGLFVGPTSQAPRLDEARHDALAELEIALDHAFAAREKPPEPWLSDRLFRNLLVDVAGNTHRTEICIDKLFSPHGAFGRQGLVELRAFEMPPHPRMAAAQAILLRGLVAAFAEAPYRGRLVRWGTELHDRFLLPHFMWSDFADVLAWLASRGIDLPADGYRPFLELRCPVVGSLQSGDVRLEVRNAIEPWNVLGEEASAGGTSRYVDSSMERVEVRVEGFTVGRHQVLVNGLLLPLQPTSKRGELVGGVRFRAWAPPHSLQAHLGIHHPVRLDVIDTWGKRSIGACAYHVWHPGGRAFDAPPLTRFEAAARRAQRFTVEAPMASPVVARAASPDPDAPHTLDLRRFPGDRPPPEPEPEADAGSKDAEPGTPRAAE